jgi:hypothetical protein
LLQFLQEKVIPVIKGEKHSPPLTKIDYDTSSNTMYFIPNQISLDPRVCIVRNDSFLKANGEYASAFIGLNPFTELDKSSNPGTNGSFTRGTTGNSNVSYIMNIYLNFEYIISSLESNTNERGDVNVYGFISSICSGLNKALGGVNNLEPVIDKSDNVLKIIDSTPIPGVSYPNPTTPYDLNLFGYYRNDKSKWETSQIAEYTSTFVRKIDLKTAITPEYATMVTIGATANGYVKGTEATAFSRWNLGIKDRFKNQINSPNPPSTTATSGLDEAEYNYAITFLGQVFQCYGFDPITVDANGFGNGYFGDLNPEIIEKNLSIATEFYKYIIAKKGQTSQQAGTIGFIPFKLGITMDGISGIKIYNKLEVNSKFLPTKYGDTLNFIITGVNHKLQNNDWETNLETIVMPKTTKIDSLGLNITKIKQIVQTASGNSYITARDNNPFNVISTSDSQKFRGVTGTKIATNSGKSFLVFDTLENGVRAGLINLSKYFTVRRLLTVKAIIDVYAGGSEKYINFVVSELQTYWKKSTTSTTKLPDFKGKTETDESAIKMFRTLAKAILKYEGGRNALSAVDAFPITDL